jgi:hypothetical protein
VLFNIIADAWLDWVKGGGGIETGWRVCGPNRTGLRLGEPGLEKAAEVTVKTRLDNAMLQLAETAQLIQF